MTLEEFKKDIEERDPEYKKYSDMFDLLWEEWILEKKLEYISKKELKEYLSLYMQNDHCETDEINISQVIKHFKL